MTYGTARKVHGRPVYSSAEVKLYKDRYILRGLNTKEDAVFLNIGNYDFKKSNGKDDADTDQANADRKAIYKVTDITNIASKTEVYTDMEDDNKLTDDKLFKAFTKMAVSVFTKDDGMKPNIESMIAKFRKNEGGVYENTKLNDCVKNHPSTIRYCKLVEEYIKKVLYENKGALRKLEDTEIYVKSSDTDKAKDIREEKRPGKETFLTPVFSGGYKTREQIANATQGIGIAVGDVWAARIDLGGYELKDNGRYTINYTVTLWDHFGLNLSDIFGKIEIYSLQGFRAWMILQHIRGYKPFITKMTIKREMYGDINNQ